MDNFHGQFFSHDFLLHSGYTLLVISESVSYAALPHAERLSFLSGGHLSVRSYCWPRADSKGRK